MRDRIILQQAIQFMPNNAVNLYSTHAHTHAIHVHASTHCSHQQSKYGLLLTHNWNSFCCANFAIAMPNADAIHQVNAKHLEYFIFNSHLAIRSIFIRKKKTKQNQKIGSTSPLVQSSLLRGPNNGIIISRKATSNGQRKEIRPENPWRTPNENNNFWEIRWQINLSSKLDCRTFVSKDQFFFFLCFSGTSYCIIIFSLVGFVSLTRMSCL